MSEENLVASASTTLDVGAGDEVLVQIAGGIATVTINRPARRNALSGAVVSGLTRAFDQLSRTDGANVIVLTGAGDKAFCAGADLGDANNADGLIGMHHARAGFVELLLAMQRCARPIVGRINGLALGGGFGLALSCDLVVAGEGAQFGTPEIKVGLFPMMIMAVIARSIGRKRAMELMLTGDRISAAQAVQWEIANYAVPASELDAKVAELATKIAGHSPAILRLGRQAFYNTQDMPFEQALRALQSELTIATMTEDAAEGIAAFFGQRAPQWRGR
jgi:enoyl-CoA hydratase